MMMNFDSAQRETCVVRETRTDTPLQALNLMNDVTFVEAARFLGQRMMKEGGRDAGCALALWIPPGARARAVRRRSSRSCATACDSTWTISRASKSDVDALPEPGRFAARTHRSTARELAAYASVASLILNLDETVTKQ